MREIQLTNTDAVALVSDDDYERVNQFSWFLSTGDRPYVQRTHRENGRQSTVLLSRFVYGIQDSKVRLRFANGNVLDNRRENLALRRKLPPRRSTRPKGRAAKRPRSTGKRAERGERMDLGLAILSATTAPGQVRTHAEIAAYCGCTRSRIGQIEQEALKKLRHSSKAALLHELLGELNRLESKRREGICRSQPDE